MAAGPIKVGADAGPAPYWDDPEAHAAWDFCVFYDSDKSDWFLLPGIAEVDVDKEEKLDVKPAPGTDGASITIKGYEPAKVQIALTMWCHKDWEQFAKVIKRIEPKPGKKKPGPFGIGHAVTSARGIASVLVQSVSGPKKKEPGKYELTVKCIEWFPQPKASAKKTVGGGSLDNVKVDLGLPGMSAAAQPANSAGVGAGAAGMHGVHPANAAGAGAAARRAP